MTADIHFTKMLPPRDTTAKNIVVLMSGGVDSSVATALLLEQGWHVYGVTMRLPSLRPNSSDTQNTADTLPPLSDAVTEAARVAEQLGVPHTICEVEDFFHEHVISPFREAYARGETPNPCCICNRVMKFGAVWDAIESTFGITHIATGHYVTICHIGQRALLCRDPEHAKDQTYFIYGIPAERLPFLHTPLAGIPKAEVRHMAERMQLPVAHHPESMELCFAGGGDYRSALGLEDSKPGPIFGLDGSHLGTHRGIEHYTLGQRRGIGVAAAEPLYVVGITPAENSITLAPRAKAFRKEVRACLMAIHIPECLEVGTHLLGMIRSYSTPAPCRIIARNGEEIHIAFEAPVFSPAPGQHLVLYTDTGSNPMFAGGCLVAGGPILAE